MQSTAPLGSRSAPLFLLVGMALWILWIYFVGFWSSLVYGFGFSLWKRQAILRSMRSSENHGFDPERMNADFRGLNFKLLVITAAQALVLLYFSQVSSDRFSGTVQRVTLSQGVVTLELPGKRALLAEPMTLVDKSDLLVGVATDQPLASFLLAIQSWKGRHVTCKGEWTEINGWKYMTIKKDRSNFTVD